MATRVLIVDDTAVFRRIVADALADAPGIEVAGTASNGRLALSRMAALQPDIVTLDIEMPEMNGIETLDAMKSAGITAGVIMVSSLTMRGGEMTVRALERGAFDFITKPEGGTPAENNRQLRAQLLPMIQAFVQSREIKSILDGVRRPKPPAPAAVAQARALRHSGPPLVLIGVSTGGPAALLTLVPSLPADLGAPVFIVQHMPAMFTQSLAASLARKSSVCIREAQDAEVARPGCVYIAPGGRHMKLHPASKGEIAVSITDDPPENRCRPSVDYLFRSVALNFPGRAVAAILTGMGNDGTEGLRMLKRGGCVSIAQDEATCVVYGMPKEAMNAGVVDIVAPIDQIAGLIVRSVRGGKV